MKGSAAAVSRLPSTRINTNHPLFQLRTYDQQRFVWASTIANILLHPNSFLHEQKCHQSSEWLQQYFSFSKSCTEIIQLTEYYKYYKNTPVLVNSKHLQFMVGYWNRKKTLYYRKIKRELQIEDCGSEHTVEQQIQSVNGRFQEETATFQLPSHLNPTQATFLTDPDATIRKLLTTLGTTKYKSTRECSKMGQFTQKAVKSATKVHLRTNPSHLISTSSFKKTKKKQQHKSLSSQVHKSQPHNKDKKLNSIASCQKIGVTQPDTTLNYQRRNNQKCATNAHVSNKPSQVPQQISCANRKKKEISTGKGRSSEKSEGLGKSRSGKKGHEPQTSINVKAAINKVKDRIKAEKNVILKKYVQSRQSHTKSVDSTQGETMKRSKK